MFERPIERFGSLHDVRATAEREYILKTLDETKGNVSRTAEMLGVSLRTVRNKIREFGLPPRGGASLRVTSDERQSHGPRRV